MKTTSFPLFFKENSHFLSNLKTTVAKYLGKIWKTLKGLPPHLFRVISRIITLADSHLTAPFASHSTSPPRSSLSPFLAITSKNEAKTEAVRIEEPVTAQEIPIMLNNWPDPFSTSQDIPPPALTTSDFLKENSQAAPILLPKLDELTALIPPPPLSKKEEALPRAARARAISRNRIALKSRRAAPKTELVTPKANPSVNSAPRVKNDSIQNRMIAVPGDGNCQLRAILKGIELQYPTLLQHEVEGKLVNYTYQDLRQRGVDFIEAHLVEGDPLAEQIRTYLDIDIAEFNQDLDKHFDSSLQRELNKIELSLKQAVKKQKVKEDFSLSLLSTIKNQSKNPSGFSAKIEELETTLDPEQKVELTYLKSAKQVYDKYLLQVKGNESFKIHSIENYCQRLRQDKFWCSTSHLFALSALLDVPIFVHDQRVPITFGPQIFTTHPSKDPKDHLGSNPIHIYRVNGNHYNYLISHPLFPAASKSN